MVKHCDRGLENTARGRRAAFSRLSQVNWVLGTGNGGDANSREMPQRNIFISVKIKVI